MTREIELGGLKGGTALVDAADYEALSQHRWFLHGMGYAQARISSRQMLMHRIILGAPKGSQVDHINGNKLDNRRCNLRICTQAENARNRRKRKDTSSQFKGVNWNKPRQRWMAYICKDYKQMNLGYFDCAIKAAEAYNEAALKHFGEFALLNVIPEPKSTLVSLERLALAEAL